MRVLVTGHKGYIGTVLTPMLQAEGHEVVGLDSDLFADCTFGDELPTVDEIIKDVRSVEAIDVARCDAIIHLAGLSNDPLAPTVHESRAQAMTSVLRSITIERCQGF